MNIRQHYRALRYSSQPYRTAGKKPYWCRRDTSNRRIGSRSCCLLSGCRSPGLRQGLNSSRIPGSCLFCIRFSRFFKDEFERVIRNVGQVTSRFNQDGHFDCPEKLYASLLFGVRVHMLACQFDMVTVRIAGLRVGGNADFQIGRASCRERV